MKVYVTTSDWYDPLIPGFAYLFNKHWSQDQEVVILCYTPPHYSLPKNFSVVSLGDSREFGNEVPEWSHGRRGIPFDEPHPTPRWTDSLRPFFETLRDEHFILLQIDYFIHKPVELLTLERLRKYLNHDGCARIDLFGWVNQTFVRDVTRRPPYEMYAVDGGLEIVDYRSPCRAGYFSSSLQAAIWKREFFLSLLKPNRTPWQFETLGMDEPIDDKTLCLGIKRAGDGPVPYLNVYQQGRPALERLSEMDDELLMHMSEQGLVGSEWNGCDDEAMRNLLSRRSALPVSDGRDCVERL